MAVCLLALVASAYGQADTVIATAGPNHIAIPNTPYSIAPPDENFVLADRFTGLINTDGDIFIILTDQPKSYSKVEAGILKNLETAQGEVLINRTLVFNGQQARLLKRRTFREPTLEELDEGEKKEFYTYQWLLVFGNQNNTTMATAGYIELFEKLYATDIEQALLSVVTDNTKAIDPLAVLGFTVSAQNTDLQFAATQLQRSVRFTVDGQYPTQAADRSQYTAIDIPGSIAANQRKPTSIGKVKRNENDPVQIASVTEVVIDSLQGYEVVAYSQKAGGPKVLRYAVVLFDDTQHYVMAGLTDRLLDQRIADFRAISNTFKRKQPTQTNK